MTHDPTASVVRHSIALRHYENGIAREIRQLFQQAGDEFRALLIRLDPNEVLPGWVQARIRRLDGAAADILQQVYADLQRFAADRLVSLGEIESEFAARLLERTASGIATDINAKSLGIRQWRSILQTDPIQGAPLRDWWATQEKATAFAFRRQVQLGMANSETTDEIIRRVRGRFVRPGIYEGGVMEASIRQAESITRTAVNQIATRAQVETFQANEDITDEYIYTATLDDRTSEICRALDGQRFKYGEGPLPPQHVNCRSAVRPVVNWDKLGLKPPPPGERAAEGGPVSAKLDYAGWLRRQSNTEQDDILGPARAKLFRAGKVTLQDLVWMDGSILTLAELREKLAA